MTPSDAARLAAIRLDMMACNLLTRPDADWLLALAERQAAEIDRLRAAMEYYATVGMVGRGPEIAREALKDSPP